MSKLAVDAYYENLYDKHVEAGDVENDGLMFVVLQGAVARCVGIVRRPGSRGRGRYAEMRILWGDKVITYFERVSSNDIGRGGYLELEPLVVLARAEETGLL